jgi:hypothetical protein
MTRTRMIQTWMVAAAVALTIPATWASARADDATTTLKDKTCKAIGCGTGDQLCGTAGAKLVIPDVGEVSVTWSCYQPSPKRDGEGGGTGADEM